MAFLVTMLDDKMTVWCDIELGYSSRQAMSYLIYLVVVEVNCSPELPVSHCSMTVYLTPIMGFFKF